jgi:hypothetical protein
MLHHDIVGYISSFLSYTDACSLFLTCSCYYKNKEIRMIRRQHKVINHKEPIKLLYLACSINDILTVKLLSKRKDMKLIFNEQCLISNFNNFDLDVDIIKIFITLHCYEYSPQVNIYNTSLL